MDTSNMGIPNFEPNSHKSKLEKKKVEKVVKGTVKTKKKSDIRKFADVFISEDATNVKSYIFSDVLVPAIKKLVADVVKDGIEMILYGGTSRTGSSGPRSNYISYRDYSDSRRFDERRSYDSTRTGYSHDDIILETRGEAEEVLTRLDELIDTYGQASVADLYDLIGKTCAYTDNKYGWKNIRNAEPVRVRDGYMLKLPKVLPLD